MQLVPTNKGLVTEFEERELDTSPRFKKPRVIGEKVGKLQGRLKVLRGGKVRKEL